MRGPGIAWRSSTVISSRATTCRVRSQRQNLNAGSSTATPRQPRMRSSLSAKPPKERVQSRMLRATSATECSLHEAASPWPRECKDLKEPIPHSVVLLMAEHRRRLTDKENGAEIRPGANETGDTTRREDGKGSSLTWTSRWHGTAPSCEMVLSRRLCCDSRRVGRPRHQRLQWKKEG